MTSPQAADAETARTLLEDALTGPDPLSRLQTLDRLEDVVAAMRARGLLAACEAEGSRAVAEALGITTQSIYKQQRTAEQRLGEA